MPRQTPARVAERPLPCPLGVSSARPGTRIHESPTSPWSPLDTPPRTDRTTPSNYEPRAVPGTHRDRGGCPVRCPVAAVAQRRTWSQGMPRQTRRRATEWVAAARWGRSGRAAERTSGSLRGPGGRKAGPRLPLGIRERCPKGAVTPLRELSPIFGDGLVDQAAAVAG